MTQYRVAFAADSQVATLVLPEHKLPEGAEEVGMINVTSVGPNPTDASTQHITTMLQRKGYDSFDNLSVVVQREPVTEVIEQNDQPLSEENGEALADAVIPGRMTITVGESEDLVKGSAKGFKLTSSDEKIVKVGRGGTVKAVSAGTATVTVTNNSGISNDVVIEATEETPNAYAGVGDSDADAREAEAA